MIHRAPKVDDENEESSYLQASNKENKFLKAKLKKKVTFEDVESSGLSLSEFEVKKLQETVYNLTEENDKLKTQLIQKNYESTYRENQVLKAELDNMYILQEENKDLTKDLKKYKLMEMEGEIGQYKDGKLIPESERIKALKEENEGILLVIN